MDYEKLRQSSEFIVFQEETSKLAQLDLRIMDANETKAFFLSKEILFPFNELLRSFASFLCLKEVKMFNIAKKSSIKLFFKNIMYTTAKFGSNSKSLWNCIIDKVMKDSLIKYFISACLRIQPILTACLS